MAIAKGITVWTAIEAADRHVAAVAPKRAFR